MGAFEGDGEPPRGPKGGQAAPSDLIDFYRRWPEFRATAAALTERRDLSPVERETLRWLIKLADRVGEYDIGSEERN
jgi:hypothetical protein